MQYTMHYDSPLGGILLAGDEEGLTGLWFDGAKYERAGLDPACKEGDLPVLRETKRWLDHYFSGREPDFMPPLHMTGTSFQQAVWAQLRKIPYGTTVTYGALAAALEAQGRGPVSAQAVGGAVGHNRISILVPCHRVVGAGGSLTGYAGGLEKKRKLLALEGADLSRLSAPRRGSAL